MKDEDETLKPQPHVTGGIHSPPQSYRPPTSESVHRPAAHVWGHFGWIQNEMVQWMKTKCVTVGWESWNNTMSPLPDINSIMKRKENRSSGFTSSTCHAMFLNWEPNFLIIQTSTWNNSKHSSPAVWVTLQPTNHNTTLTIAGCWLHHGTSSTVKWTKQERNEIKASRTSVVSNGKRTRGQKTAKIPETSIHPNCSAKETSLIYCRWNSECWRMSSFLCLMCLSHASCPVYQFDCVIMPHPLPLPCSLIQSYWDQLNLPSHTNTWRWWCIRDGANQIGQCVYVCVYECVLTSEPSTSAWAPPCLSPCVFKLKTLKKQLPVMN